VRLRQSEHVLKKDKLSEKNINVCDSFIFSHRWIIWEFDINLYRYYLWFNFYIISFQTIIFWLFYHRKRPFTSERFVHQKHMFWSTIFVRLNIMFRFYNFAWNFNTVKRETNRKKLYRILNENRYWLSIFFIMFKLQKKEGWLVKRQLQL
jgi:hypothetical protein